MQIVIDIPDKIVPKNARPCDWVKSAYENIHNCKIIVLPKGHGRLIDESEIQYNEIWMTHENGGRTCVGWEADIDNAPTILEADIRGAE